MNKTKHSARSVPLFYAVMGKLFKKIVDTPRLTIRGSEDYLKYSIGSSLSCHEFVRQKALELNLSEVVIEALTYHMEQLHLDYDMLSYAKKHLSVSDYALLLDSVVRYTHKLSDKFNIWSEIYLYFNKLDYCILSQYSPSLPGFYNIYLRSNKHFKQCQIPEQLYLHDSIWGYPEPEWMEDNRSMDEKKSPKNRIIEPSFYGDRDDICTIQYKVKQIHFPAKELIDKIVLYYQQRSWALLDYDLAVPHVKGGYLSGWRHDEYYWSQCWVDALDNVVNVGLRNSKAHNEITVYATYITNQHTKDALFYYRNMHHEFRDHNSDSYSPVGSCKDFRVFLFPRIDSRLSQETRSIFNLITGRWRFCTDAPSLAGI